MATGTETFTAFIQGAPVATAPTATTLVPVIQGGVTKQLPASSFPNIGGGTYVPAGPTYTVLSTDTFLAINQPMPITILLPTGLVAGRYLTVADCGGNAANFPITIVAGSGDVIDGYAMLGMFQAWQSQNLQYLPLLHLWKGV